MRSNRWTTRRLMMIVAVAALLMAYPAILWRRSLRFEEVARAHRRECEWTRIGFTDLEICLFTTDIHQGEKATPEMWQREAKAVERRRSYVKLAPVYYAYHANLEKKYKRTSDRPWLPVAPDPPPPPTPSRDGGKQVSEITKYLDAQYPPPRTSGPARRTTSPADS